MEIGHRIEPQTFRLERTLKAPVERVWVFFTDAEKRSRWFGAGDDITALGQVFTIAFGHHRISNETPPPRWAAMDGSQPDVTLRARVLAFEPPRLLEFTWGEGDAHVSYVRFEFTAKCDETLLVLTHSRIDTLGSMRDFAGGWAAHIETLCDVLVGRETNRFWAHLLEAQDAFDQSIER